MNRILHPYVSLGVAVLLLGSPAAAQGPVWATSIIIDPLNEHAAFGADRATDGTSWIGAWSSPFTSGNQNAALARLDAEGRLLAQAPLPSIGFGRYLDLAAGLDGEVFAIGYTNDPGQLPLGPSVGGNDAFVARFGADGTLAWAMRLGGAGDDRAYYCASDPTGAVFVTGGASSDPAFGGPPIGTYDSFVARVERDGTVDFVTRVGAPSSNLNIQGVVPRAGGGCICIGDNYDSAGNGNANVFYLNASGSVTQTFYLYGAFKAISPTPDGGCFALGGNLGPWADPELIFRLDSQAQVVWTIPVHPTDFLPIGVMIHALEDQGLLLLRTPGELVRISSTGLETDAVSLGNDLTLYIDEMLASDGEGGALLGLTVFDSITSLTQTATVARVVFDTEGTLGCTSTQNSTGEIASLSLAGDATVNGPRLTMHSGGVPPMQFAMFVGSTTPGLIPFAGGAAGPLCVGGSIRRFNRPGEIQQASRHGFVNLRLDPQNFPGPISSITVSAGEIWHFQLWFRDGGGSNFSSSRSVTFH